MAEALDLVTARIRLVLPGAVVGADGRRVVGVLKAAAAVADLAHEVITFPTRLDAHDYRAQVAGADVLLLPLAGRLPHATVREEGGRTKVSGGEHDQLRAGKYALVDARYYGNPALAHAQTPYPLWRRLGPRAGRAPEIREPTRLRGASARGARARLAGIPGQRRRSGLNPNCWPGYSGA